MKIGCQTFSWQMSYEKYADALPSIFSTIQESGFQGVEAEVCMLGRYYDVNKLKDELNKHQLQLAALTLALPWKQVLETREEKEEADRLMELLASFPDSLLLLVQLPGNNRNDLQIRQKNAINCMNRIAERAADWGITTAYHPNSSPGSIFRNREDYDILFSGINDKYIGYAPDTGHIVNGGMDVIQLFEDTRSIIKHVHFKDFSSSGDWIKMGEGSIDHPAIVKRLKESGYAGWIIVEEESHEALTDPDGITRHNGDYVSNQLMHLMERN